MIKLSPCSVCAVPAQCSAPSANWVPLVHSQKTTFAKKGTTTLVIQYWRGWLYVLLWSAADRLHLRHLVWPGATFNAGARGISAPATARTFLASGFPSHPRLCLAGPRRVAGHWGRGHHPAHRTEVALCRLARPLAGGDLASASAAAHVAAAASERQQEQRSTRAEHRGPATKTR